MASGRVPCGTDNFPTEKNRCKGRYLAFLLSGYGNFLLILWLTMAIMNSSGQIWRYNISISFAGLAMEDKPPEFMTIEEVSEYLRVPISSLYKLAQQGKIPASKVGRHWRFRREFIDRWINDQVQTKVSQSR